MVILLLSTCKKSDNESLNLKKIENMVAFTKVYGYVKYFHPSDEAFTIDWDYFAIYGAEQMLLCETKNDVLRTLERLFKPIAPSINFGTENILRKPNLDALKPSSLNGYQLIYWQHKGLNLREDKNSMYQSVRVLNNLKNKGNKNSKNESDDNQLFNYQPELGEYIEKQIGDGLYCQIPLILFTHDKEGTFPKSNNIALKKLKLNIDQSKKLGLSLNLRIGNIINTYNVFQHFYPYLDVISINWKKELEKALSRCFTDITEQDHLITLQKFTAPLKDGHISFRGNSKTMTTRGQGWGDYILPISWSWVENKLVITEVHDDQIKIKIGDVVTKINNDEPEKYFEEIYSRISAGNKGWLNHRAEPVSLLGDKDSNLEVMINNQKIKLFHSEYLYEGTRLDSPFQLDFKVINDSVIYLNLKTIFEETIDGNYVMPRLKKSKYVICDVRGYPAYFKKLIPRLMTQNDTTKSWLNIPKVVYPDQNKLIGFFGYTWSLKKEQPYLGDKKFYFLTDGSAISYAESCIGYIKGYNLGKTIGEPTAGTNGNINKLSLPGNFKTNWTGMKALKLNGTRHHGVGFIPDIPVSKTIDGIKNGKDEVLEKAIELTENK